LNPRRRAVLPWRRSVRKRSTPAIGQDFGSAHLGPRVRAQQCLDAGDTRLEGGVIAKAFGFERPICPIDFEHVLARGVIEPSFYSDGFVAARKEPHHRTFRLSQEPLIVLSPALGRAFDGGRIWVIGGTSREPVPSGVHNKAPVVRNLATTSHLFTAVAPAPVILLV
jgi:hypothetical protein